MRLKVQKMQLLKNIVLKVIECSELNAAFFTDIIVPGEITNITFVQELLAHPQLFDNEGEFLPYFNDNGNLVSIAPHEAINLLFCKGFENDILMIEIL